MVYRFSASLKDIEDSCSDPPKLLHFHKEKKINLILTPDVVCNQSKSEVFQFLEFFFAIEDKKKQVYLRKMQNGLMVVSL